MSKGRSTETVSVQTTKDVPDDANTWQIERAREGIKAVQEGRVRAAEDAFADIAAKHGWNR